MNAPHEARPIRPRKWAGASKTDELVTVDTWSGYARRVMDPAGAQHDMQPDVSDEMLGAAVVDCLSRSRFLDTEESRAALYNFENGERNYLAWIERLMHFGGYKTRRALFKQMMSCGIEQEDDTITIRPSHHEKLEGWSGKGITEADYVVVSASSPPAAIGAALREAFRRCT
jgi:hypothetical protein